MEPITEREIRTSFVNCSKGEALRLGLPADLAEKSWPDLDFLGWRDPGAPERAYLVAPYEGRLVGVSLRASGGGARGFGARSMCSVCFTTRTGGGVALMTARRTGEAGRQGNSIGQYLCTDLQCSLFVRGIKTSAVGHDLDESIDPAGRIARANANLHSFLNRLFA
ncbi:FBP domain-containing protein [Catenulispora sp. NF23]|uniref:FBP domain-containing protein n=1 Tax=Catenulispora pinistramenti TaxID=2705254 RepID=A0ABS5KPA9_9ACTN|nr:FBP domain-containing protein [Catenulispora pinistramenti]MBS2532299.1 FBP domain-containing protein [Catenulispora pinistramenti]MBS2547824.1 FBP domain-containing protein [Catenulispora pinistramenti]